MKSVAPEQIKARSPNFAQAALIISGTSLANEIEGFSPGDSIKLTGISYSPHDRVTVGSAGIVTIVAGGEAYHLDIAGAYVGEDNFKLSKGLTLTETSKSSAVAPLTLDHPAQMTILTPSATVTLSGTCLPALRGAPGATASPIRAIASVSLPDFGWLESRLLGPIEFDFVMVTLR